MGRKCGMIGTSGLSFSDQAFSGCLIVLFMLLICCISVVVITAAPVLGISLLIGGPAIAFRHQIGRNAAGVILILLGTVQLAVLAATHELYESTD